MMPWPIYGRNFGCVLAAIESIFFGGGGDSLAVVVSVECWANH